MHPLSARIRPSGSTPAAGLASRRHWGPAAMMALALTMAVDCSRAAPDPGGSAPLPPFGAILDSPLRTEEDHQTDLRRKPLDFLRFAQVRPGMQVLDVSAGNGYTTQLLALAVGPDGAVWAQNPKARAGLEKRLAAHPQANIHPLVRPFADPYPADAPRLDLITFVLNYHDVANEPVDRAAMNRQLFAALKPGGHLVLIDHAAAPGSGLRDTRSLHRIDEALVVDELQRAGFVVEERSDFLRAPDDPRDQAFFDRKEPSDRFALRLRRP
jgi:predicted methyltransferase